MHQPSYFKLEDSQQMLEIITNNPLATIVSLSSNGLVGNHIPMIVVEKNGKHVLQGHVSKVNSIWQDYDESTDIIVIFHGPESYISPNWYSSKKVAGKEVPTWDYVAVHVSGKMSFFHDKQWLTKHLIKLSDFNEQSMPMPWKLTDAPVDYIDKMLGAIVGFEIEITNMTAQVKMSQNHPEENRKGVISGLRALDKENVALWVEKPNG